MSTNDASSSATKNRRGEKSLSVRAHQQIDICCETLCDKEVVQDYIKELEAQVDKLERANKLYEKLHNKLMHEMPEKSGRFFICGALGDTDDFGVPERLMICPSYGSDGFYVFKKERDYDAPGY